MTTSRRAGLACLSVVIVVLGVLAAAPRTARADTIRDALGLVADPTLDARRAAAAARATARCMTARGWVFTAVAEPVPPIPDADLDPVSWAARWGFGVSTAPLMRHAAITPDPNLERIATRPVTVRTAFLAALHGRPGHAGCATRAATTVYGSRDRILAPLHGPLATLAAAVAADPDLVAAVAAWRRCVPPFDDDGRASGDDPRGVPDRATYVSAVITWFAGRTAALGADPGGAADLRATERRVAVVVARCEAAYVQARRVVDARHQAPFVDRYRAVLAALGAEIRREECGYPFVSGGAP